MKMANGGEGAAGIFIRRWWLDESCPRAVK
jgi:hypothetical protein